MSLKGWKTGFKNPPRYTPAYYQRLAVSGPPPTVDITISWVQKKQGFAASVQESFTLTAILAEKKQAFAGSIEEIAQVDLTITWAQKKAAFFATLGYPSVAGATPSGGMISRKKFPGYDRVIYPEAKKAQEVDVRLVVAQKKPSFFSGLITTIKHRKIKVMVPVILKVAMSSRKQGMSAGVEEQVLIVSLEQRGLRFQAAAVQIHTVEIEVSSRRHSFHARARLYSNEKQEMPKWIKDILNKEKDARRRQEEEDEELIVLSVASMISGGYNGE